MAKCARPHLYLEPLRMYTVYASHRPLSGRGIQEEARDIVSMDGSLMKMAFVITECSIDDCLC